MTKTKATILKTRSMMTHFTISREICFSAVKMDSWARRSPGGTTSYPRCIYWCFCSMAAWTNSTPRARSASSLILWRNIRRIHRPKNIAKEIRNIWRRYLNTRIRWNSRRGRTIASCVFCSRRCFWTSSKYRARPSTGRRRRLTFSRYSVCSTTRM